MASIQSSIAQAAAAPGQRFLAATGPTILQVLPALQTGGVERGACDMAAAIMDAGWRAIVASAGGPMTRELERAGALHLAMPLASKNPLVVWRNAARLEAAIRRWNVDIVHARSRAPAWSARWAAHRLRVPLVTTFHGTYNAGGALKHGYNAVMTGADRVIAISDFIADELDRPLGKLSRKHETIALRITDPLESKLPRAGKVVLIDPETGLQSLVNTNNPNLRMGYEKLTQRQNEGIENCFKKYAIDSATLDTRHDTLLGLHRMLKKRARKRSR